MFRCVYCGREFDKIPRNPIDIAECPGCASGKFEKDGVQISVAGGRVLPKQIDFAISGGSCGFMANGQYYDFSGTGISVVTYLPAPFGPQHMRGMGG